MSKVITRKGQEGQLEISNRDQSARVQVGNVSYLVAYMRDKKVKVKNDLILNEADLARVRTEMKQFIKREEPKSKKRK